MSIAGRFKMRNEVNGNRLIPTTTTTTRNFRRRSSVSFQSRIGKAKGAVWCFYYSLILILIGVLHCEFMKLLATTKLDASDTAAYQASPASSFSNLASSSSNTRYDLNGGTGCGQYDESKPQCRAQVQCKWCESYRDDDDQKNDEMSQKTLTGKCVAVADMTCPPPQEEAQRPPLLPHDDGTSSSLQSPPRQPLALSSSYSYLLNVPFYVYHELYWLNEGMVGGNMTVQYWVENKQTVKHTDDWWFAKAALVHPMRTTNPENAKLFIVPTLLNVVVDQMEVHHKGLCLPNGKCDLDLLHHVDEYLERSPWFQRHQGRDHLLVASHWASEWHVPRFDNIMKCNIIGWGNRNYGRYQNDQHHPHDHDRVIMPKLYVGQACPQVDHKTADFAMIATMKPDNPTFQSRTDICTWMTKSRTNLTGYAMSVCGAGKQCPALANARFGFHVRGDTYGSNRLIDTLLSGTVPIFTFPEQYDVVPDWIDWKMLSYNVSVSDGETAFVSDVDAIVADVGKQGYDEKLKQVILNRDLFDWKTPVPFDTYLYMLSVHLWPELEIERRKKSHVSSPYTALILPRFDGNESTDNDKDVYVPFRAFDFKDKRVSCGGTNKDAPNCGECKYFNERNDGLWNEMKESSMVLYWTSNLNLLSWWKWESDPRACRGGCTWTGTKCIHKSHSIIQ